MTETHETPLLDTVKFPQDIREFSTEQLTRLAGEIRQETIRFVSISGGHLGASLGVVELTVALHYVFNTPEDRLIWDVGHQSYPHKILTGRKDSMHTLRQGGGISGFTKRSESEYDPFGAGHSSTSISAGLGMSVGRNLLKNDNHVIAVIGDGSMSAGMAYEAMNNAGAMDERLIVILNDNDMSIAPPVGAMSAYLSRIISSGAFRSVRHFAKVLSKKFPRPLEEAAAKADEYARGMMTGGTLFEELGFYYVGPVDGHNLEHLLPVLINLRDDTDPGPVLLHVVTQKGRGYTPAEEAPDKYHGVGKFNLVTGELHKSEAKAPSYTKVFSDALVKEAETDDKILAITAAMPAGTGLDQFAERFPERFFDVGIAEQHAVTFAAGLAVEGFKPFVALYSSFLQRGYDQLVHDVMLQNLPVRFAIDRAGLVGADGATHAGNYDIANLCCLPGMVVMAAADEAELKNMVATAAAYDAGPIAFRYPRGNGLGVEMPEQAEVLKIGKGRIVREGSTVAILSLGTRLEESLKAADELTAKGYSATVADARFAKPFDVDLVRRLVESHELLITIEEGSCGGFGANVMQYLATEGLLDNGVKARSMTLPDRLIRHDDAFKQYDAAGLNASHIVDTALNALNREVVAAKPSPVRA